MGKSIATVACLQLLAGATHVCEITDALKVLAGKKFTERAKCGRFNLQEESRHETRQRHPLTAKSAKNGR
jgi:hypothetical protein